MSWKSDKHCAGHTEPLPGKPSHSRCVTVTDISSNHKELSPQALTLSGLSPGDWGIPLQGNFDEAWCIFGAAGCVWATTLRPKPL